MNILIIRAFVRLREILATHKDLARKIEELELQQEVQASQIAAASFDRRPQNASVAVEWLSRWNVYRHSLLRIRLTSFGHARSISTGC